VVYEACMDADTDTGYEDTANPLKIGYEKTAIRLCVHVRV